MKKVSKIAEFILSSKTIKTRYWLDKKYICYGSHDKLDSVILNKQVIINNN